MDTLILPLDSFHGERLEVETWLFMMEQGQ